MFLTYSLTRLQAEATSQGSHEYYEDVVDLLNARKESSSANAGVTVGIYYVEAGIKGSSESEFLKNITQYSSQVSCVDPQVDFLCDRFCHSHVLICGSDTKINL